MIMRMFGGMLIVLVALFALSARADDAPQAGARLGAHDDASFYAGLREGTLDHEARHDGLHEAPHGGLPFGAESFGTSVFGGFKLRDNLSLEVSAQSDDSLDRGAVAGYGAPPRDINSGWDTVSVKAVGELPLQELLSWRRNWRLFGTLGYYRSDLDRTQLSNFTGIREKVRDDESGVLLGTGVLRKLGFLELRGYMEWYGVFSDREAWDAGVAVQLSF